MVDQHPIYHRPQLHCGKCHNLLVFPRKHSSDAADIKAGKAVLAECITCAVGVMVPAALFAPSAHKHVQTIVVTHQMRTAENGPHITLGGRRL